MLSHRRRRCAIRRHCHTHTLINPCSVPQPPLLLRAVADLMSRARRPLPERAGRSAVLCPGQFTMPLAVATGGLDEAVPPASVLALVDALSRCTTLHTNLAHTACTHGLCTHGTNLAHTLRKPCAHLAHRLHTHTLRTLTLRTPCAYLVPPFPCVSTAHDIV